MFTKSSNVVTLVVTVASLVMIAALVCIPLVGKQDDQRYLNAAVHDDPRSSQMASAPKASELIHETATLNLVSLVKPAPTVGFCNVQTVLPRNTPLATYSPLLCFQYSGLAAQKYTAKVYLLETGNFFCASGQWCGTQFTVDNQGETNSTGSVTVALNMDVFNYQSFLWKIDLYDQGNVGVATAEQPASSTLNRAPVLNPVGNKTVAVGQSLDFTVSASDPENDAVSLSAQNLPPGATFNNTTGQFHWQPSSVGTFSSVGFIVTQLGATPLSDAELINITVGTPPPAVVLAFSAGSAISGEGGPVVLIVTRTNGSAGAVSVAYSTINGTATSGSDYVEASGNLLFADRETTKTIRLTIINNSTVEANETFQVVLSAPTGGATLGVPSQATVTIVDDDTPQLAGQWGGLSVWPTVPIHMHLLPNGKVMFWDRHNHNATPMWDVTPRLWDPAEPAVFTTLTLPGWDIFCSGHTLMADGRVFVAGGHIADFKGTATAGIYDPFSSSWTALPNMNDGRWYPSTTTLPNGDVLVIAGTKTDYADINLVPQVLQTKTGTWRNLSGATLGPYPGWADYYPYTFVAPNGKVFVAGPQKTARYLDTTGTGNWTDVASSSLCYRDYGSSVIYDDGKVLIVGGNPRDDCDPSIPLPILPSATAEVINLGVATPAWRSVAPMAVGRRHLNTTILPDGKVLVTGGSSAPGHDDPAGAVFFAELWDPNTEVWTPMAAHTRYRGYHSNAMLLPDARVLIAGGGHPDPVGGTAENNAEIYSPPYLFTGTRPVITTAPSVVAYGQTFSVQTPDAANIANVNWIRLSSVTHAFNESQRINRLTFSKTSNSLSVTAPANANLCPPGHYMLFILDGNGVPSVAKIVQVVDPASLPPCPTINNLSPTSGQVGSNVIITGGNFTGVNAVRFANNVAALFSVDSDTQISATVPVGAVTGPINLSKASCSDTTTAIFTVNPVNYTIAVSASPTAGGAVMGGGTFAAGSSRTVTGTANSGFTFVNWTESGSVVSTSASYTFTLNGNRTLVANFSASPTFIVQTNTTGSTFTVDGTSYNSSQTFSWAPGSNHSISTTSPQSGTTGTQYVWSNWSDGGAISHSVTAPASGTTYTANFTTQFFLTMNAGAGGTVSPASAFFNSGQVVNISATPNINFSFSGWIGSASGSFTGPNNPASVTMNGPITETANFTANPNTVQFNSAASSIGEGAGFVNITITRSGSSSGGASVDYATSNDTAKEGKDYVAAFGVVSFAAGEASKSFPILIIDNALVEGARNVNLTLSNPSGAALGTQSTASLTITDNDLVPGPNPLDTPRSFVQYDYYDFLGRYPDTSGWDFWTNQITNCGSNAQCIEVQRINVSASFFLSIEFQQTGYLVERFYKVAYGNGTANSTFGGAHSLPVPIIRFDEFLRDSQRIGRGVVVLAPGWDQLLESNKQAYANEFVQTSRFIGAFPATMTPAQFVDQLNQRAGNVLSTSERTTAINLFGGATDTSNTTARAQAVRLVAEDTDLYNAEYNRAFVLAEYFGYLRRNPNDTPDSDYTGYDFWLTKLNQFNGNYINAEMVKAFLSSIEYRQRFGP